MSGITFTFDLEDPRPSPDLDIRFVEPTQDILNLLHERQITGTFFVVAKTAQLQPELIRQIHQHGHEIGLHSYDHRELVHLSETEFHKTTSKGQAILEDICGTAVQGYRAPNFSLTANTPWVPDILAACGFSYSSSILPAAHPFHGFPGAPTMPFRWPSGVLELPAPVTRFGPTILPFLGGIYFRYLPTALLIKRANTASHAWFYCHPYDFDPQQPYYRLHNTSHWTSVLLWLNRQRSTTKLAQLLDHNDLCWLPPFAQQIAADTFADVQTFTVRS